MILLFASGKGGTGKTTVGVQMATYRAYLGRKVLLIDMDKQGSASLWASQRAKQAPTKPKVHDMQLLGAGVGDKVRNFAPDYDDIVIDTRGTEAKNREMYEALMVADRVITPIKISLFDSITTLEMSETINMARGMNPKLEAFILLNECSNHVHDTTDDDLRAELIQLPYFNGVLETQIGNRNVFKRVPVFGQSVTEWKHRDKKAVAEVNALAEEVWQ
jgi:chromosome partitioning protein